MKRSRIRHLKAMAVSLLRIDVLAMPDVQNRNTPFIVINLIDDAVIA